MTAHLSTASATILEALRTTAGNISSLGPAGALGPREVYEPWLRTVKSSIALAECETGVLPSIAPAPDLPALVRDAMRSAEVRWSDMSDDERGGRRLSDYTAAAVLSALRQAGALVEAKPCG